VDTLLPVVLISGPLRLSPRYVVKTELKWDPVFDVIGQRMRNIFVLRGSNDPAREIANVRTLAEDLDPRSVVVIYPEGTRRTPERRARILNRMRERSDPRLAYSEALKHTLPPKHGGPLALMSAAASADIVICGHVGFDDAFDIADVVNGSLIGRKVFVRYWHFTRSEVPTDESSRADWLDARWADLDAWVAAVSG
jgi:1-acyl-sn-glycerol-3-phosphate acyltransferase